MSKDEAEKRREERPQLTRDEQAEAMERYENDAANAEYKPVTAHEVVATRGFVQGDREKEKAAEAGVTSVHYVDYEAALENYQNRPDVEPLAARRAREIGYSFEDAAFRRQVGGAEDAGLVATDTSGEKDARVTPTEKGRDVSTNDTTQQ